jgi:hypothetical protein
MSSRTVVLIESWLLLTTIIVLVLGCRKAFSCFWVMILPTILLTTRPTPSAATPSAYVKDVIRI